MKFISPLLLIVFSLCIIPGVEAARKITITSNKSSLATEEELLVSASISGFIDGEKIYIKGAFYKEGSKNYFGYTRKGDTWVKNSAKTADQPQVTVNSWDRTLIIKSDYADTGFSDNGAYLFKLGFYTINAEGNPSSVDWSDNSLSIILTKPLPTATSIPSSTPVPTQTPTKKITPAVVTSTHSIAPTERLLLSTAFPTADILGVDSETASSPEAEEYFAAKDEIAAPSMLPISPTIIPVHASPIDTPPYVGMAFLLLGTGIICCSVSVFTAIKIQQSNHP